MRWSRSLKYGVLNAMVPVVVLLLRMLGATLRKTVIGGEIKDEYLKRERAGIGAFLHCDLAAMALWGMEMARLGRPITVLTSPSRDGQIFAGFLRRLGLRTVQGSSNKRGVQGMLALVRALKEGHHIGIVVDGPRGPRGSVKQGVIWLSKQSGAPVFPVASRIRPHITLPTWDRAEIPIPLARYEFEYGAEWYPGEDTDAACEELSRTLLRMKGEEPLARPEE